MSLLDTKAKEVQESIKPTSNIKFIIQENQLGTGHALQVLCHQVDQNDGNLLVLNGDVPLIKSKTLKKLIDFHNVENADVSLITTNKKEPMDTGESL